MTAIINLNLTDYMKIAALIADSATDESGSYEMEYTANGYSLFLNVTYDFDAREECGGSYEDWDFECLTVVDNEQYDVTGFDCYDSEGEPLYRPSFARYPQLIRPGRRGLTASPITTHLKTIQQRQQPI